MKKLAALALVLGMGFGLNSCNSDDGDSVPQYTVVGKWKITKYTVNGVEIDECSNHGVRQFKNDGVYLQDDYQIDPVTEQCLESEDSPLIGTFTKTEDNVTTKVGDLTKVYELDFVDANQFVLTETFNNIPFVYTYSRQ